MPSRIYVETLLEILRALKRGEGSSKELKAAAGTGSSTTLYRHIEELRRFGITISYERSGGGNRGRYKVINWGCVNKAKL